MAVQAVSSLSCHKQGSSTPYIDLSFDVRNSEASVLQLVYKVRPQWERDSSQLQIVKFTEGITNTLLKVSLHRPDAPDSEADDSAVLMRAYGNGTDLIIDRDKEAVSHGLLADRGMAPPLLARFRNGLLYGFIPGYVCKASDLVQEPVWRGVAQKLGEWHARVPVSGISSIRESHKPMNGHSNGHVNGHTKGTSNGHHTMPVVNRKDGHSSALLSSRDPIPNVWSVMQKWVNALSTETEKERARKTMLQQEMERSFRELDSKDGIGEHGFVFAHCDLLCANVIQMPIASPHAPTDSKVQPVTFIDYEYATPAPAVFDISNHFAEWVGYDCDYSKVPGKSVRRKFIHEYVASYDQHSEGHLDIEAVADKLYDDMDHWRGIPGLYWGIWSLIQAKISEIDFNYSEYAELRLGEYFAWRAETDGSRQSQGLPMPLREQTWASD